MEWQTFFTKTAKTVVWLFKGITSPSGVNWSCVHSKSGGTPFVGVLVLNVNEVCALLKWFILLSVSEEDSLLSSHMLYLLCGLRFTLRVNWLLFWNLDLHGPTSSLSLYPGYRRTQPFSNCSREEMPEKFNLGNCFCMWNYFQYSLRMACLGLP